MLALEARCMGYRIVVLDPNPEGPAAQVADQCFVGQFDDLEAAKQLAQCSDVVTLDTEHVPSDLLEQLEELAPVRPSAKVLGTIQDRLEQRRFLESQQAPQVRYCAVSDLETLRSAGEHLGFPFILKTRRSGYDGKGQARIHGEADYEQAWSSVGEAPSVAESFVDFEKEISVLLARDMEGNIEFHPVAENDHRNHILHTSRVPARVTASLLDEAQDLGARLAKGLDYVGMMAIELFVTKEGQLLVNEIAPRTHNSGHYTFGACLTSQFEQHLRAICGLPLGDSSLIRPAAMLNLLGDLWRNGEPDWRSILSRPNAHLHLYGKSQANPGRKMGHVLVMGDGTTPPAEVAETISTELEEAVSTSGSPT